MVYHVTHPEPIQWSAVLDGLEKAGLEFDRVPPVEWLDRMDKTTDDPEIDPTRGMLHMWRAAVSLDPRIVVHEANALVRR